MDDPLQILIDELASQGKTWDEIMELIAGLENPWNQLDYAEWLALHRGADRREILAEKHRLMRNTMHEKGELQARLSPIGEKIRSIWADGELFMTPVSYELKLDVPVYIEMESGWIYRLFGDSFSVLAEWEQRDVLIEHLETQEFNEATSRLQVLCGKTIQNVQFDEDERCLEIVLDGKSTIKAWSETLDEFSVIRIMERLC